MQDTAVGLHALNTSIREGLPRNKADRVTQTGFVLTSNPPHTDITWLTTAALLRLRDAT